MAVLDHLHLDRILHLALYERVAFTAFDSICIINVYRLGIGIEEFKRMYLYIIMDIYCKVDVSDSPAST